MTGLHAVYLCGPMTGLPEYNYPAFHAAAEELRCRGLRLPRHSRQGGHTGKFSTCQPRIFTAGLAEG